MNAYGTCESCVCVASPAPIATTSPDPFLFAWNSRNISRQWFAPGAVANAGDVEGDLIFGSCEAYAGVRRTPSGGSAESGASDRTAMSSVIRPLFGRMKLPLQ